MVKRFFCFLFAVIAIVLSFPFVLPTAAAEASAPTDLYTELSCLQLDGKPFVKEDYPAIEDEEPQILMVNEVGDYAADNYRLYVYVYNPGQIAFKCGKMDRIQLAVHWKNGVAIEDEDNATGVASAGDSFEKFKLQYVSSTADKLFYKFEILDHKTNYGYFFTDVLEKQVRMIEISGIELQTEGDLKAKDYLQDQLYQIRGTVESGKTIKKSDRYGKSVELDVHYSWWRNGGSDLGKGHEWQVNTIYFSVPEEFTQYGEMSRLRYEAYEYKTSPVLITDSKEVYDDFYQMRFTTWDKKIANSKFYFYHEKDGSNWSGFAYNWYFNIYGVNIDDIDSENRIDMLGAVILTEDASPGSRLSVGSSDAFLEQLRSMPVDSVLNPTLNQYFPLGTENGYSRFFFDHSLEFGPNHLNGMYFEFHVDQGQKAGYDVKDVFAKDIMNFDDYSSTHGFWKTFADYGAWVAIKDQFDSAIGEDFSTGKLIKSVSWKDLCRMEDEEISDTYFLQNPKAFANYVYEEEAKGRTVWVVHFAVRDYLALDVTVGNYSGSTSGPTFDCGAYIAQETVFLDFDVIEVEYRKDDVKTVIAVINDPQHFIADFVSSPDVGGDAWKWWKDRFDDFFDRLTLILTILIVIVVVTVILYYAGGPIKSILSFLVDLLIAPFKWLLSLFDGGDDP